MKKKIFILLLLVALIPLKTFALSFSPYEGADSVEVGADIQKLYDYCYYTYAKPENTKVMFLTSNGGTNPERVQCQITTSQFFVDSTYNQIDYAYLNGNNIYWVPVGANLAKNVQRKIILFDFDSNGNYKLRTNPSSFGSGQYFGNITVVEDNPVSYFSYNGSIYTDSTAESLYNFNSVENHYIRTFEDIEKFYSDSSDTPDEPVTPPISDNTDVVQIIYILCIIIFVFFFVYYFKTCFPMKGGKDLR